jgi:hypothetical protein
MEGTAKSVGGVDNYSRKETFHTPRPQANHEEGGTRDFGMRGGRK